MELKKYFNKETILFILLDIFAMGLGMGVPMANILIGFPLGWYVAKKEKDDKKIFRTSVLMSLFTFLLMLIVWGRCIFMIFDSSFDFANFGHPFILFDPKASFIAWVVLMIVISPALQLLTTVFGAFVYKVFRK